MLDLLLSIFGSSEPDANLDEDIDETPCPECAGTGMLEFGDQCPICNGSGFLN